jgi:hypothetical protein
VKPRLASLLIILLIQCGLVLIVYWPKTGGDHTKAQPLAPFGLDGIEEIHVGDEFDNETVLVKVGTRWSLSELEDLPADGAMVEALLNAIRTGSETWPVADSVAARQRFRVASYHYRRRIRLLQQDQVVGTLFLGASPGFRKVYARNETQDAIYSITFNAHDAPGNSDGWLDRKLLQIRAPVSIVADGYSLRREGDNWLSGTGQAPEERELKALLKTLRSLQVDGLASEDAQRDLAETEADLVLDVQSLGGDVTLELFHQSDRYFIHSSEYPLFFKLGAYDYDRLLSIQFPPISRATDGY